MSDLIKLIETELADEEAPDRAAIDALQLIALIETELADEDFGSIAGARRFDRKNAALSQFTLTKEDRAVVEELVAMMMAMNERNDRNAGQTSTYGHLYNAIASYVLNQVGVDIKGVDWNIGGSQYWADDIQEAIDEARSLNEGDDSPDMVLLSSLPKGEYVRFKSYDSGPVWIEGDYDKQDKSSV